MAVSLRTRMSMAAGVIVGALALVLSASPASAQAGGPGAQATPVVGVSPTANCPTPVAADLVAGTFTVGPFTVGFPAAGRCTSFSADAEGSYTVGGSAPLPFTASCQATTLQHFGGVDVPAGTIVNLGQPNQYTTTTVETITHTTTVRFPNGTVATLNVVTTTATSVTRTAIVSDGVQIGRVICGAANVYPLAVDTPAAVAAPALPSPISSSGDSGGAGTTLWLAAGAFVLAVAAQVVVGRRMWRRKGDIAG